MSNSKIESPILPARSRSKNAPKSPYRLVDYVFILGADIGKKLPNTSPESALGVVYSYPPVYPSSHDSILLSKLPGLCFSAGYTQTDTPAKPFFSALVITDERKHEHHMVAITFSLKWPSQTQPDVYLPYCLCIYSQFALYHLFRAVLYGAYNQHIKACKEVAPFVVLFEKDSVLRRNIRRFVDETPAPSHGKLKFILNIFSEQVSFGLPALDDFPLHDVPLLPLFTTLDPHKIVQLLNHMVFDQQLLIISPDPSLLGVLLEGLRSLLYPLAWEHVYVPCIPTTILHNILQAPIPFLIGVCLKTFSEPINKDLILVDLSNQGMFSASPEFPFPHRLVTKLCARVSDILKKVTTQSEWGTVKSMESESESSLQMDIREAFLDFFVGLLKDVEKFIDVENDTFKESEYIFSFASRKQAFVSALLKTQAFEQLRLRMAMGSPTVQLFKECVVAKYMEKSCKRVYASKREERAKTTFYHLPLSQIEGDELDPTQRLQSMISDVTNLMTQPNDHTTQATLLMFRASLHGQMREYYKALQDTHRSIQMDDSVVSDDQLNYFIAQLTEIEISKALSTFGPRIKRCIVLAKNAGKKSIVPSTSMRSMGLKAEQKISVQLRQNISNLQLEMASAKRQNQAFKMEIGALKDQVAELTLSQVSSHLRQSENWEEYDVVFDIRGLIQLSTEGWPISVKSDKYGLFEAGVSIKGSIAAFVGLYNKGKTFLLNKLSDTALPSGSKVTTRGVSVKVPKYFDGQMVLLDTAGTHAPIQYRSNDALLDRRATELFLQDLVFDITDYHIVVVNDLTWQDQEYIDTLVKKLQDSQKIFKQVIVVHNFKGSMDVDDAMDHWKAQVLGSYPDGDEHTRPIHLPSGEASEVHYYISGSVRHVFIGKEHTPCGEKFNEATYALLRGWLRDVVVEYGKALSPMKTVVESTNRYLPSYVEGQYNVIIDKPPGQDYLATIRLDKTPTPDKPFHLRPFTLGWLSPKIEPDNFVPLMDKYSHRKGVLYVIELPGVAKVDLKVSQKEWPNVYIEGEKKRHFHEGYTLDHAETKSGCFKIQLSVDSSLDPTSREITYVDSILQIKYKTYNWEEKE